MKVLAVGGGSGGHVTPVIAVLRELKQRDPSLEIRFWCDRKFAPQAQSILHSFDKSIPVEKILAGKLRRYHSLPWWRQLLRPFSIVLPNVRDIFFIIGGFVQSLVKLLFWRPDVVFTKGGFVCLPVGIAAKLLRIPLVIHDSDAHPGLTNQVLAKFATAIATGAELKNYPYPKAISKYIGVPISPEFHPVRPDMQRKLKQKLGLDASRPLVVVTGGGLGAENINVAVAERLPELLAAANVILIAGTGQYDSIRAQTPANDPRFQLHAFINGMVSYLSAADIVVTRAGATTILELATLAKPTILIPSPYLSAGHQLKNAAELAKHDAVEVVNEVELDANPQLLVDTIIALLGDKHRLRTLGENFRKRAKPNAAKDMADIILHAAK
ncbi:UDP-N-acetylglucosamine--N-acetylmuramyl-(pentapeptide) pyrophosphoryl-undecaprenol N-acetylglucosamine transferase [Streptomyces caniscabiei]|uniref:UDP-N-acetylglucosamine--N-acetylmuramyl- (pentapeptide) pyrophosphoryl-undecaprenol N-acetylglucosamine transferase n=1 Tax=Streptomyces caniscabiei TaxID=2746961 RepID=UPI0029BE5AC9|nr:UDP-N-acetylglucosamine--N-acetylmuramyl-(pentapeptide) pyrophosphoryl-undecaprenol N-acetylglucosamine transferase [Streptomyces caniscabiei]MDX2776164.1 UDP-N-acetylglucosamine--N-acetylmuramyl-(pentapeptide) pyrophosphoryl-undecaprenol N-acetylglucosamine transferase [Streptomyces caniscabiei]